MPGRETKKLKREGPQMKKAEYGILDVIAHVSVMATLAIVFAVF